MERILNQEEIDALFKRASQRPAAAKSSAKERTLTPCDFRHPGLSKEHTRSLSSLHEGFARTLTASLGAFLRIPFSVNLVSVELMSYVEFLQRIPELVYLASLQIRPADLTALMQMDLALAFPLVDLLLGGKGGALTEPRDLTEIEEQILETVVKIMLRELQRAWEAMELEFELERRQQQTQVLHLMAPTDRLLSVTFEIRVAESRGNLNVAIPSVVSSALLRKLSERWTSQKSNGPSESASRLRKILAQCPFEFELSLPVRPVPAKALLDLAPGSVLPLPLSIEEAAEVVVGESSLFTAEPIRSGRMRAAHVLGAR